MTLYFALQNLDISLTSSIFHVL